MTAADPVEGDNTHDTTRLEELHALLDEFHEAARDQARGSGGDDVTTIQMSHASAMVCKLATLDEAQRFAYEILALVDQGRAQGWDPSLRRAAPEMIPLSRTLSGPVP